MIHRYISLPEIAAGNMSGLEGAHERDEALRRLGQGILNLAQPPAPRPAAEPPAASALLDAAGAARYLSCAKSFIRRAYRSGKLPGVRMGARYVRFTKDALDAFAASGQTA